MNNNLYKELLATRNNIRTRYASGGRTPQVCSDESIYEIARTVPRKKEDLLNIKGLGPSFVEKYGDIFMKVINKHAKANEDTTTLSKDVKTTLKNLEARLVNISKRNRLLYLGKLYPKYAFDLFSQTNYELNQKLNSFVFGKIKSLIIANTQDQTTNKKENEARYKKLTYLIREINKDYRETGEYDLYLGWPFAVGKTRNEDFSVCAPLVLFPIEIARDTNKITIKIDQTKDILYNNNLILLNNKLSNINKELPNNVIEDVEDNFITQVSTFYKQNGLNIPKTLPELSAFPEYNSESFPDYSSGEFALLNTFVLGKFSLYESSIQKDYKELISRQTISNLLSDLLENIDDVQPYAENEKEEFVLPDTFEESSLHYINQLNVSQENAIRATDFEKELVIQGPPGTGKSQTITSLIADCVCAGKNVLMVSQKKAALDVIYSRLGTCANQTLLIHDTKDKENFYDGLKRALGFSRTKTYDSENYYSLSRIIDHDLNKLQKIASALYNNEEYGTKMYKIYQENPENRFNNAEEDLKQYYSIVPKDLLVANYLELKKAKQTFENQKLLSKCTQYQSLTESYPWLESIKDNLTLLEKQNLIAELENFVKQHNIFMNKNWFKRLFGTLKQKIELKKLTRKYFQNNRHFKKMYKNYTILPESYSHFNEFCDLKPEFSKLEGIEPQYLKTLRNIQNTLSKEPQEANSILFDFVVLNYIDNFETYNRLILSDIKNYSFIVAQVASSIEKKKDITKDKLKANLQNAITSYITRSKRYSEILRIAESKRKWSVNKFLQKFGFELLRGIKVWLMTPETVSEVLPLENGLFDIVIFDEASQIYIEKGIPTIARGKQVVISGDHKQLRPSSLGFGRATFNDEEDEEDIDTNAALEEESLLDLARFKYKEVLLNYHYRAKYAELINFSNYAFYKGRLNVAPNLETPTEPPIKYIKVQNGVWDKRSNKQEAQKVVELVKQIFATRQNNETFGVITFNSAQRDLILDELDDECAKDPAFATSYNKETIRREKGEDVGFFVKNIENVQGDERDIIIFSLSYARNKEGKVVRNFGWLNQLGGENRLNVAISRAKQKIFIVTSLEPNELVTADLKNEGPKLFRKYLDYSLAISEGNEKLAKSILNGFIAESKPIEEAPEKNILVESVYKNLKNLGYNVAQNVGIGNYKFDLAITNENGTKYILGLECDGSIYAENTTARERDISSAAYYKARGWNTYRIWSNEWWHNKEKVLSEIQEKIN